MLPGACTSFSPPSKLWTSRKNPGVCWGFLRLTVFVRTCRVQVREVNQTHMELTEGQIARMTEDLSREAKEPVRVEDGPGELAHIYGSELAVLRLFSYYNSGGRGLNPKVRVYHTEKYGWYLTIERF